jgi:hypothetical protein
MKKITLALLLTTGFNVGFTQKVSIPTKGKEVVTEGKLYSEFKEKESYATYSYKRYAGLKDAKLILTNVKINESGSLNEVEVNTIELSKIEYISSPQSPEESAAYSPQIYSALVKLKKGEEYTTTIYNYQGDQGNTNTWNYPLFLKSPANENITAIKDAITKGNMDGVAFKGSGTSNATASKPSAATTSATETTKSKKETKEDVTEITIEVQNTSKEQIFVKYDGGINGSSFLGAGTVTRYKAKPGAKILNKKTGAVLVEVTAATKSGVRFKI